MRIFMIVIATVIYTLLNIIMVQYISITSADTAVVSMINYRWNKCDKDSVEACMNEYVKNRDTRYFLMRKSLYDQLNGSN